MAAQTRTRTGSRSDIRGARFTGVLLLAGSVIAAVVCTYLATVMLPTTLDQYRAYKAAVACPDTLPVRGSRNCLRTVTFAVKHTVVHDGGRGAQYQATLSGPSGGSSLVSFGDPGPVLSELRPGDRVSGTVWRGHVMRIARDGAEQATADEPRDEPQMYAGLAVTAGLLAALSLWFGAVRLVRPRNPEPYTWRLLGRWLLATVLVAGLVWGYAALWFHIPWQAVPPVAVALTAVAARGLVTARRDRPHPGPPPAAPGR
ncbi:hypothetical protein ABT075_40875 [Streptomyces sp. NPDC002677]|uniref:hypothetical protein n=1 Tax=Streptomyces sp. NPDC002677 TaxID=3154774 RepID=UPI00332EC971